MESILPRRVFNVALSVDAAQALIVNSKNTIGARIYLNLCDKHYRVFVAFFNEEATKEEITFSFKPYLNEKYDQNDRLVLYMSENELGKTIKLLMKIGDEHQEFLEFFGPVSANMFVFEGYDWFGLGHEPQWKLMGTNKWESLSTYNEHLVYLFKCYFWSTIIMKDFNNK